MPSIKTQRRVATLVDEFNEKIRRVSRERPDIADIQPLKRSISYVEQWLNLDHNAQRRAVRQMEAYLKKGAEERSKEMPNMTKWAVHAGKLFTKRANSYKESKAARSKLIYDVDKGEFAPDFKSMSAEEARRAVYALELEAGAGKEIPEQLKQNYLKAIERTLGFNSNLLDYFAKLPAEKLVDMYYWEMDTFKPEFFYSQDEAEQKEADMRRAIAEYEAFNKTYYE